MTISDNGILQENLKAAARKGDALGERIFEATWTTRDNFLQGAPPTGGGWKNGLDVGEEKEDKQDKGGQVCRKEAGGKLHGR
jgi:hypothetical protein